MRTMNLNSIETGKLRPTGSVGKSIFKFYDFFNCEFTRYLFIGFSWDR